MIHQENITILRFSVDQGIAYSKWHLEYNTRQFASQKFAGNLTHSVNSQFKEGLTLLEKANGSACKAVMMMVTLMLTKTECRSLPSPTCLHVGLSSI